MAITTQGASYPLESFGPTPPISQGTGGYQYSAGNRTEPLMLAQGAPAALTGATVTVTAANLASGIITVDSGGTDAGTYTFPTGALIDAAFPSVAVNTAFDVVVINLGDNAANDVTFGAGSGNTIVGNAVVADSATATFPASATFRFRKTGTAAYSIYRIG
jgi:hypothetical protein